MPHPVTITGPRLSLREYADADGAALHAIYSDPTTTEHLSFEPRTREQVDALLVRVRELAAAQPRVDYTLALNLNTNGQLIGTGRLALSTPDQRGPNAGLRPDSPAAQFGLAIHAQYWGQGYGREALSMLVDYAFSVLGVDEVWGACGPANLASSALMKSAGFVETMTIRDHITKFGAARDSVVHVLRKNAWRERPAGV